MKQFETRFKQVDVLPMVKHYMKSLDLYDLFKKYVPASSNCLAEHAESLCIITANIICDNKPLYKVQEWLAQYADGLTNESGNVDKFNDDRLARSLSALFKADRHSLMTEVSCNAIKLHQLKFIMTAQRLLSSANTPALIRMRSNSSMAIIRIFVRTVSRLFSV
jgi:hypothetical protein